MDFIFHLDDDDFEISALNEEGKVPGVLQDWTSKWTENCWDIIDKLAEKI